jgi:hypothetical protein
MCRCIRVQCIDADYLVVCAGCQVFAVRGEADRVDGARVVAHSCELLRLRVFGVGRIENRLGGPYTDVSICEGSISIGFRGGASRMSSAIVDGRTSGCRNQTRPIGRDVTAVDFEVFEIACVRVISQYRCTVMIVMHVMLCAQGELTWVRQPLGFNEMHGRVWCLSR